LIVKGQLPVRLREGEGCASISPETFIVLRRSQS